MSDTELPTWLTEGAEVAIYNSGRGLGPGHVKLTTVTKIQKLYVVTAGGSKFRRCDLQSTAKRNSSSWDTVDCLAATTDPRVEAALKSAAARRAVHALTTVIENNRRHGDDPADLLRQVEEIRDAATKAHTRLLRIIES